MTYLFLGNFRFLLLSLIADIVCCDLIKADIHIFSEPFFLLMLKKSSKIRVSRESREERMREQMKYRLFQRSTGTFADEAK